MTSCLIGYLPSSFCAGQREVGGVDPNPSTSLAKAANLEAAVTFLCETGVQLPATAVRGVGPPCVCEGGMGSIVH